MTWLRANRRRFSLLSALVLALQTLAVTVAVGANTAAAAAEGSNLVMICTANGIQMVDLSNPDSEPVPVSGQHQCPLCIVGCANCAAPAFDPALLVVVIALLVPVEELSAPVSHRVVQVPDHRTIDVSSPRGPPQARACTGHHPSTRISA